MSRMNMVLNVDYWDGLAAIRNFNGVCDGYTTEEEFFAFTEHIPNLTSDMKFLDFGCGPGRIVKTVAPVVKEYVGVDVSEGLLEIAREHHREYDNVSFVKCNGMDLWNFDDQDFDYIYERLVFIHNRKSWIEDYIPEFFRVLKPGGIFYIPDLPKEDVCINGFTESEVQELFKDFKEVTVTIVSGSFEVKGIK